MWYVFVFWGGGRAAALARCNSAPHSQKVHVQSSYACTVCGTAVHMVAYHLADALPAVLESWPHCSGLVFPGDNHPEP